MKIICTEQEKKELIAVLMKAETCPRFLTNGVDCGPSVCIDCLNNNIEWEITDTLSNERTWFDDCHPCANCMRYDCDECEYNHNGEE